MSENKKQELSVIEIIQKQLQLLLDVSEKVSSDLCEDGQKAGVQELCMLSDSMARLTGCLLDEL